MALETAGETDQLWAAPVTRRRPAGWGPGTVCQVLLWAGGCGGKRSTTYWFTYLCPSLPVEHRPLRHLAIALCSGLLWPFQSSWPLAVSALLQCLTSYCCEAGLSSFNSYCLHHTIPYKLCEAGLSSFNSYCLHHTIPYKLCRFWDERHVCTACSASTDSGGMLSMLSF